MKAVIIFAGSGPILILTTYASIDDPNLLQKLATKGMDRFIAYEVSVDLVRQRYGHHFDVIMEDVKQTDDLRVLDYNGANIMRSFSFSKEAGPPHFQE